MLVLGFVNTNFGEMDDELQTDLLAAAGEQNRGYS
jgi:hypothetical protein